MLDANSRELLRHVVESFSCADRLKDEKNWSLERLLSSMKEIHYRRHHLHHHIVITRKQSEPADLRQGHVVRQEAAPYSIWQRFPLCPIESNGNENFKVIQNPRFLPDHPRNWITSSFCLSRHSQKISERSVHNFLSYLADTQTDKQTKSGKNITSLAEVKTLWARL